MRPSLTPRALLMGTLLLPLLLANCSPDGDGGTTPTASGMVAGRVVNALTAAAVANATVNFGSNQTTTTNATGDFTISLPVGIHSATISGSGYVNTTISGVLVVAEETTNLGTLGLSPPLPEGQTRIILTWNAGRDLDSHLRGPIPNSTNRFHVYYSSRGSLNSSPFAALDRDDLTGPGPETITISQMTGGTYRYAVHDFTGDGLTSSFGLWQARASVRVVRGATEVGSYLVPNQGGTLWTVFEMDGASGNITVINSMTYQSPSTVQSVHPGTAGLRTDAQPKH